MQQYVSFALLFIENVLEHFSVSIFYKPHNTWNLSHTCHDCIIDMHEKGRGSDVTPKTKRETKEALQFARPRKAEATERERSRERYDRPASRAPSQRWQAVRRGRLKAWRHVWTASSGNTHRDWLTALLIVTQPCLVKSAADESRCSESKASLCTDLCLSLPCMYAHEHKTAVERAGIICCKVSSPTVQHRIRSLWQHRSCLRFHSKCTSRRFNVLWCIKTAL